MALSFVRTLQYPLKTYVVKYFGPALESDALKDREHGQTKIIEVCDAIVRTFPKLIAAVEIGSKGTTLKTHRTTGNWIAH